MSFSPAGRRLAIVVALACAAVSLPAVAFAAAPVSSVGLAPSTPDGLNGWWVTSPLVSAASDQDGTLHWSWDAGAETTVAVLAGTPVSLGFAPDGSHTLSVWSENAAAEAEFPPVLVTTHSDPLPPDQVLNLAGTTVPSVGIDLSWDAASDPASGVDGYVVYRSVTQEFLRSDVIAYIPGTSYRDVPPPTSDHFWYAVSAIDVAGNESLLSDSVRVASDLVPPTAPADVQAWRTASGHARVTWVPSWDGGSGVAYYELMRSVAGAPYSVVATITGDLAAWEDADPVVAGPDTVDYKVAAYDGGGLRSPDSAPARLATDVGAVLTPSALRAVPEYRPTSDGSAFAVSWTPGAPTGAGDAFYELEYTDQGTSHVTTLAGFPPARATVVSTDAPAAYLSFRVRTIDRAGNESAWSAPVTARHVAASRIGDADRSLESVMVSASDFASSSAVVVASRNVYTDALVSSGLAGALRAPILLVGAGPVPSTMIDELDRLGASTVYVVGGPATVSTATLESMGGGSRTVTRVWGPDRYSTAAAVQALIGDLRGGTPPARAYVVSGKKFPDALSIGPAAYAESAPILFAHDRGVPGVTLNAIASSGTTHTLIAGGPMSVWRFAERVLPGPMRIGGADRYAVSRGVASWAVAAGVLAWNEPCVATGLAYPDGLIASARAGHHASPLLLTTSADLGRAGLTLAPKRASLRRVWVIGPATALSDPFRRGLWNRVSTP